MMKKNDLGAKITVLIIAIFIWSFVMDDVNPEISRTYRNVSVNYSNTSALDRQGLVVMDPESVAVDVKVTGKKSDFGSDKFSASNILARVDLSGYSEGQVKIPITVSLVDQPSGISVSSVEPRESLFTFDKLITKEMPLTIRTTGTLPENYVLGELVSSSRFVSLSGPRTWVNEVDKVVSEVNVNNRISTDRESFTTLLIDEDGNEVRGISKEPNVVEITVPVYRTVTLPIELQTINELPENYSIVDISITPSNIAVRGNEDIKNLTKIDTEIIDINTLIGNAALEVELDLPQGVSLLNPNQKVTIIYDVEETITKEFTLAISDLDVLNLDEDLEIDEEDLDREITITLAGYKSVLDQLESEDLRLSIDLSDLMEGRHVVEVKMAEIQGIDSQSLINQPLIIYLMEQ
ncbi:MAG: CdaR family protein [Tissierellia bacterium]|nr:CdaR family protein [Tissierellia bacterium]